MIHSDDNLDKLQIANAMEKEVTQRIRQYLKVNRYTIRTVSQKLHINEGTLTNKLNGVRQIDMETFCSLVDLFPELSTEWLLRGEGTMIRTHGYEFGASALRQVSEGGDNVNGYGHTITKTNDRLVELLEKQLEEEKNRSREYWNTIQQLIKK